MGAKRIRSEERRDGDRHQVRSLLPLRMTRADGGGAFPCRIDDVSADGLGILARGALVPGAVVVFETLEGRFHFDVVWCRAVERGELRCGLELAGAERAVDLRDLFSRFIPPPARS